MNFTDIEQVKLIGTVIRSVSQAQAERFFKSEQNTQERARVVFSTIMVEIFQSLYDAGVSLDTIMEDIDPTDDILIAMRKAGFDTSELESPAE